MTLFCTLILIVIQSTCIFSEWPVLSGSAASFDGAATGVRLDAEGMVPLEARAFAFDGWMYLPSIDINTKGPLGQLSENRLAVFSTDVSRRHFQQFFSLVFLAQYNALYSFAFIAVVSRRHANTWFSSTSESGLLSSK